MFFFFTICILVVNAWMLVNLRRIQKTMVSREQLDALIDKLPDVVVTAVEVVVKPIITDLEKKIKDGAAPEDFQAEFDKLQNLGQSISAKIALDLKPSDPSTEEPGGDNPTGDTIETDPTEE